MSKQEIKLGYEIGTGKIVTVKPSHLIATGITQLSGKTTTQEALIKRSGCRAIVFKTKVGESGFTEGKVIPPYFKERSDWQYVSSLLEATLKERLKFERAWIIKVCKNADSLYEVKRNIDKQLSEGKLNQLSRNVYTTLQAYFELILPQLEYAKFSRTLTLHEGINIMDLEMYREEIQSLVIRSVLETVLTEYKDVIVVMPEAWKFLPQGRGNPCKHTAEAFIRQGATNGNYLWIDSQDMAGVDKTPLKQVSTWILGLQQERNEVIHTLDQIPLSRKRKPKPEVIMTLPLGHFVLATPEATSYVYVQPAWLDDETARKIALGEIDVKTVQKPEQNLVAYQPTQPKRLVDFEAQKFYARVSEDLVQMRNDFFSKITELSKRLDTLGQSILEVKARKVNTDEIVSLVLQKMPIVNKQEIVEELAKRIPKMTGTIVYEVNPLEKLQRDFLENAKAKVMQDVASLDTEEKQMLKFTESIQKQTSISEIMEKCLFLNASSGSRTRIKKKLANLNALELIQRGHGRIHGNLKGKITKLLEINSASPDEIEQVYNHVLMEML
jgi:hypothetical protein